MRQSNYYVILFSVILTVVLGGLLAATSEGLAPQQKKSVELDTKKQILGAVMDIDDKDFDVLEVYDRVIKSEVVDFEGNVVTEDSEGNAIVAEDVNVEKQFKKSPEERLYPVFKYFGENAGDEVESYILPVYGNGLWDNIWGFIALDTQGKEIKGAKFGHAGETPGLGARITESEVQERYKGKELYNEQGELVSVQMLKGENNPESKLDEHHIDGMSGATITGTGVNEMLKKYFKYYQPYFNKQGATATL
ncbi:NADH:ubiquinone reductase (Na(+)-transporting) subunit C [Marivirga sp. S37H4]|uniref:Na(+)-translocating NADH-quinone reductase subunit C n=1 Tax=Marivirga aurantiaca TaxID=2802615 RepID=A0A934X0Y4_9BACT|nr:NADH:ubiquinone reductase (Na(+)-transporting) subunit C [Marivirga aurantiaca]MBK6266928.1 NADH:ubiquinone reductase (Na(+)-transporting) subunit C [Marivirga aurantiaca]